MNITTREITTIIESKYNGIRIDLFLTEKFTYHSRNQWQKAIKNADILLNNKKTRPSRKLQTGEKVAYVANYEEHEVNKNWSLVYEDKEFLLVNKPPNLPCHPAGPFFHNTLWALLVEKYGKIYMINRLDRETSGLMLIAKSASCAKKLSELLQNNSIKKQYYCLVHGKFPEKLSANGYLSNDINSQVLKKRVYTDNLPMHIKNETSETHFELLEYKNDKSLLKVTLKTGRLHQIRATLFSLGYPVVGDKLYGLDDSFFLKFSKNELTDTDKSLLILDRQALQAYHLSFPHPTTKKNISFSLECEF